MSACGIIDARTPEPLLTCSVSHRQQEAAAADMKTGLQYLIVSALVFPKGYMR
jgi:hypothetical protein